MRKLTFLIVLAALALPAGALADKPPHPQKPTTTATTTTTQPSTNTPSAHDLALQACKTERSQMGLATFKSTYGSAGLGKCVAKTQATTQNSLTNAAKQCKDERSQGLQAFLDKYGTNTQANGNGAKANAFGKCVSMHAKQSTGTQTNAVVAAAAQCKADRNANPSAFTAKNAFGKCVSAKAKTK